MQLDAFENQENAKVIYEKVDAPTSKQVAVIWVSEDGVAPNVHGTLIFFMVNVFYFIYLKF